MKKKLVLIIPIITAIVGFLLFRTVFLIGYIPSESMEPTLKENSIILGLRTYGELKTGDIVIFKHDGSLYVKRIAAIPGETIIVEGEKYTVPQDSYFMLGDNHENSYDSRFWANPYVSLEDIVAKIILPVNT